MSTTAGSEREAAASGSRLRDLRGAGAGVVLFAALGWSSAQWLTGPTLAGTTGHVLLMCALLGAGTALASFAPRAGVVAGVSALLLVLLGRAIGEPADVSLSLDGFPLPQAVLRSGAHQPIVIAAAVAVLVVGVVGLHRRRTTGSAR